MISESVRSGHAPGHLRNPFLDAVEELPRGYRGSDLLPLRAAAGRLWNCTDVFPGHACDILGIERGSSYAQAARHLIRSIG
jgi:hypothetical protein